MPVSDAQFNALQDRVTALEQQATVERRKRRTLRTRVRMLCNKLRAMATNGLLPGETVPTLTRIRDEMEMPD